MGAKESRCIQSSYGQTIAKVKFPERGSGVSPVVVIEPVQLKDRGDPKKMEVAIQLVESEKNWAIRKRWPGSVVVLLSKCVLQCSVAVSKLTNC
jgi:hypothetical protein